MCTCYMILLQGLGNRPGPDAEGGLAWKTVPVRLGIPTAPMVIFQGGFRANIDSTEACEWSSRDGCILARKLHGLVLSCPLPDLSPKVNWSLLLVVEN